MHGICLPNEIFREAERMIDAQCPDSSRVPNHETMHGMTSKLPESAKPPSKYRSNFGALRAINNRSNSCNKWFWKINSDEAYVRLFEKHMKVRSIMRPFMLRRCASKENKELPRLSRMLKHVHLVHYLRLIRIEPSKYPLAVDERYIAKSGILSRKVSFPRGL